MGETNRQKQTKILLYNVQISVIIALSMFKKTRNTILLSQYELNNKGITDTRHVLYFLQQVIFVLIKSVGISMMVTRVLKQICDGIELV